MDLRFQNAAEQDIDRIFQLSKELIDSYEDLASIDYDSVLVWMRRKIALNIATYTRILADGRHAGYFRFCPDGDRMELDDLYVFPEFQGRGIGTAVIKKCCGEAELPVTLYVFAKNTGAIALYKRLGFRVTKSIGHSRHIMQYG